MKVLKFGGTSVGSAQRMKEGSEHLYPLDTRPTATALCRTPSISPVSSYHNSFFFRLIRDEHPVDDIVGYRPFEVGGHPADHSIDYLLVTPLRFVLHLLGPVSYTHLNSPASWLQSTLANRRITFLPPPLSS